MTTVQILASLSFTSFVKYVIHCGTSAYTVAMQTAVIAIITMSHLDRVFCFISFYLAIYTDRLKHLKSFARIFLSSERDF